MKKIIATVAIILAAGTIVSANAQRKEWANYERYSASNKEVLDAQANGAKKPVAVLMGDSITDGWASQDPEFFKNNNLVGRGISGQCTAHMLARFQRDVVELHPKYVAILAGINDIALNDGFASAENAYRNIISMCQIARQNKIKVILCSTTTPTFFPWRREVKGSLEQSIWLNNALKEYAKANHFKFVDYAAALSDANGVTATEYSSDAIHPNITGYKKMEGLLLQALR